MNPGNGPEPDQKNPPQPPRHPRMDRRLIGFALAGSVILAGVLYFDPFAPETPSLPVPANTTEPDLLIEDATITQYRDTGTIRYLLRSPRIEHFQQKELTYLTEPDLELRDDPGPPWRITARQGIIRNASELVNGAGEEVQLEEDVLMSQRHEDGRNFELRTSLIRIHPEREYAETDRDVMITTHAGRTRAVGLSGSLDKGLLQLFSSDEQRVHTILLPDQFK